MSVEQHQSAICEDLIAFERRLTEIVAESKPTTKLWRFTMIILTLVMMISAFLWVTDPETGKIPFYHVFHKHTIFVTAVITMGILIACFGMHRKISTTQILVNRARTVLGEFNMSCDDNGKLILRPHIKT